MSVIFTNIQKQNDIENVRYAIKRRTEEMPWFRKYQ